MWITTGPEWTWLGDAKELEEGALSVMFENVFMTGRRWGIDKGMWEFGNRLEGWTMVEGGLGPGFVVYKLTLTGWFGLWIWGHSGIDELEGSWELVNWLEG
jgi:hypothetical protein